MLHALKSFDWRPRRLYKIADIEKPLKDGSQPSENGLMGFGCAWSFDLLAEL